ncbi:MAG: hypothetical protein WBQ68_09360 [Terriglobales bacterium]
MAKDERDLLDLLKFELKFLEDGGYGRSPRTPWRRPTVFEDSLTCPNFGDPAHTHPCSECLLMEFVPAELKDQVSPCRLIPLTPKGETAEYFYRCGTQLELEEALAGWLRDQISQIEDLREKASRTVPTTARSIELDGLQQKQWLIFATNLYLLGRGHRDNHDYVVAHALYGRALGAAQNVAASEAGLLLAARILKDQQAVCAILRGGQDDAKRTESEDEVKTVAQP